MGVLRGQHEPPHRTGAPLAAFFWTLALGVFLVLLEFADAANLKVACPVSVAGPVQVRNNADQFFEMLGRELLDVLGIEHRNAGG